MTDLIVPVLPEGVMGRAGVAGPAAPAGLARPATVTTGFHLPDVSEFQPNVNWDAVKGENGGAAIVRALYGTSHVDTAWANGRRAAARAAGISLLGIYQYVRQDQDVVAQARALAAQVGQLHQGEFLVMDLEEGSGNQLSRAIAWMATIDTQVPAYAGYNGAWLYSGLNFALDHGLSPMFNSGQVPSWIAAYTSTEPSLTHDVWQHSNGQTVNCSHEPWPGAGFVDCSMRGGGFTELQNLIYAPGGGSTKTGVQMNNGYVSSGTGVQTMIDIVGGSANGISFGADAGYLGANAPHLRVACKPNDSTNWEVTADIRVPVTGASGKTGVDFVADNIGLIAVVRISNGAADNVPVAWCLY